MINALNTHTIMEPIENYRPNCRHNIMFFRSPPRGYNPRSPLPKKDENLWEDPWNAGTRR